MLLGTPVLRVPSQAMLWRCMNQRGTACARSLSTITANRTVNIATAPSSHPKLWHKSQPFEHVPWRSPSTTKGTIHFLGPTKDGKPAFLNFKNGEEHQTNFGSSIEQVADVTDLRNFDPPTTLTFEGIEWVYAPSVLSEDKLVAQDKSEVEAFVRGPYFDECAQLVKTRTGAAKTIAYNFRHRQIQKVGILSSLSQDV